MTREECYITMDSFGQDLPQNWAEIAAYLNEQIDCMDDIEDEYGEVTPDGRDRINDLWERYWSGDIEDAPKPIA